VNEELKDYEEKEVVKTEINNSSIENSQHLDLLNETLKRQSIPETTPHFKNTSGLITSTPSSHSVIKGHIFVSKNEQFKSP